MLNTHLWKDTWRTQANCLTSTTATPDDFFDEGAKATRRALAVCSDCTVRTQCLFNALAEREDDGVSGGTTQRERAALRRAANAGDEAALMAAGLHEGDLVRLQDAWAVRAVALREAQNEQVARVLKDRHVA